MRQATFSNSQDASTYVAQYIVNKINSFNATPSKPFVLGLPTGSSPEGIYKKLIEFNKAGLVTFKNVITFNMDEYLNLSPLMIKVIITLCTINFSTTSIFLNKISIF